MYNKLEILTNNEREWIDLSEKKITSIGGQAVIEGVMMRGPFKTAVSIGETSTVAKYPSTMISTDLKLPVASWETTSPKFSANCI